MTFHPPLSVMTASCLVTLALAAAPLQAAIAPHVAPTTASAATAPAKERRFLTRHEAVVNGKKLSFAAEVEEHFLLDAQGRRGASVFTIAYRRLDVPKNIPRPILFAFNGGPGSASLWLNMGYLAPKRIDIGDAEHPRQAPPFRLVENQDTPLDVADIVLIDPPGTGFSRILPDGKPEAYFGTAADARMTVDIINKWIREKNAWNTPKFLMGESYGSVRAALVARMLAGGPTATGHMDGVTLNGVILLGQDMMPENAANVRALTSLPSLAASACYHGRGPAGCTAQGQARQAQDFILDSYGKALWQGASLPAAQRSAVVATLSALLGLPAAVIDEKDLRIQPADFARELLADKRIQLGLYDARFRYGGGPGGGDPIADDPAMGQYVPGFIAGANMYLRDELKVTIDAPYHPIEFISVNARWNWGDGPGIYRPVDAAKDMAIAMRRNPALRLFIGTGYYDLVTSVGAAAHVVNQAGFPPGATELHEYESGHMPYLGDAPRRKLAADVRDFVKRASRPGAGAEGAERVTTTGMLSR